MFAQWLPGHAPCVDVAAANYIACCTPWCIACKGKPCYIWKGGHPFARTIPGTAWQS